METKNSEETIINDGSSKQTDNNKKNPTNEKGNQDSSSCDKKKNVKVCLKSGAVGTGAGIFAGGLAAMLMGMAPTDDMPHPEPDSNSHGGNSNPTVDLIDDGVAVANDVNDDMTFGEAFAAAREEVGPGGVFEWHGQIHTTYTIDEWNALSPEEQRDFNSHFAWNQTEVSDNIAQVSSEENIGEVEVIAPNDNIDVTNDDIDIVSVDRNDNSGDLAYNTGANHAEVMDVSQTDEVDVSLADDIEVLGVVHNDNLDANVGVISVDGHNVVLIDVDNDMTFDAMGADLNGNGQVDDGEIVDIRTQNLTVDDLGGFSDMQSGDMYASGDGPDYLNDEISDAAGDGMMV